MPSTHVRQTVLAKARKIVVKIGTSSITDDRGRLDLKVVSNLASQISQVMANGVKVTLVASGAIGAGMAELDLPCRPKTLPMLQAAAAVGQGQLMRAFHDTFARFDVKVAQVLLTRDVFEDRTRYLNARNALAALGRSGVLAIINENDVVAVDELRYGDNDIIAAMLCDMLAADALMLLTTVAGVIREAEVVDAIELVDDKALGLATGQRSKLGSGGMASKIAAAGVVTRAGAVAVIACAAEPNVIPRVLTGEHLGTVFFPSQRRLSGRRRWIGTAARAAGRIVVDAGAAVALAQGGKSLLPSGIQAVSGHFRRGATVIILDTNGRQIARGLSNYSAEEIDRIKGLKTSQIQRVLGSKPYDEVIHRNNMTVG